MTLIVQNHHKQKRLQPMQEALERRLHCFGRANKMAELFSECVILHHLWPQWKTPSLISIILHIILSLIQ